MRLLRKPKNNMSKLSNVPPDRESPWKIAALSLVRRRAFPFVATALFASGLAISANAQVVSWTGTVSGNWSDLTWSTGVPPDGQGVAVAINNAIAAPITVDLGNTSRTVGSLVIGNSTQAFTVGSGTGALIFDVSNGNASLTMNASGAGTNNSITAPITLTSSLDVFSSPASSTRIMALSGKISGAGALTIKATTGKVQLNNSANDFTGGVILEGGTLSTSGNSYLGAGTFTITGGAIQTVSSGTMSIGGTQTWTGNFATSLSNGSLNMGTAAVNLAGGTRTVTVITNNSNRVTTVGGVISNGGLALSNSGTSTGALLLSGVNTYGGTTTVNSGTMRAGSTQAFGVNSAVTMANAANATLDLNGFNNSVGSLAGGGATGGNVTLGAGTLTVGGNNASTSYGGVISGTGGLTKQGFGAFILTGNNTYSGLTNINAGSLLVNGSLAAGSAVTVASGATLGGNGSINGTVAVNGTLAPGNSIGTLTVANDVAWNGSSGQDWKFELGLTSGSNDQLLLTGAGSDFLKGTGGDFRFDFLNTGVVGTFTLIDWASTSTFSATDFTYTGLASGLTGSFGLNGTQLDFTIVAVPEPSASLMMFSGLAMLIVCRRRKNKMAKF